MNSVFVEVLAGSSEALRAQLADAARATLEQGKSVLVAGLDNLPAVGDGAISAIILALRTLRSAGGTVRLVTLREDHRERLSLTALDQVFDIYGSREEAERTDLRSPRKRGGPVRVAVRAASAALTLLIGIVGSSPPAQAQAGAGATPSEPAALAALTKLIERNPNLETFEADMRVDVRMISFPFLRPTLEGKTYFKRPAGYEVVFNNVPSYAKGLEHLYADVGDPSTWDRRFVITVDGERVVNGRRQLSLRMVQRVRGMIEHEEVLIDEPSWTISELQYHYYNGGTIALHQAFAMINGYAMVASQTANIAIPHVRAVATATYSGFRTNVAIDDSVFAKNRQAPQ